MSNETAMKVAEAWQRLLNGYVLFVRHDGKYYCAACKHFADNLENLTHNTACVVAVISTALKQAPVANPAPVAGWSRDESAYDLAKLREAATTACKEAVDIAQEEFSGEPTNWADLHCVSAESVIDDEGNTYYRVWIEEASPDCGKLRMYIYSKLRLAGYSGDIEVHTEW